MFFDSDIRGDLLPARTVCLTYDDGPGCTRGEGPGPQTLRIARYLHRRGIRAAFFAVGRHARRCRAVLREIFSLGHIVGNHTDGHPDLVRSTREGGDPVAEVLRAEAALRSCDGGGIRFFRPPYGSWREPTAAGRERFRSSVATPLNRSSRLSHLVGPIHWDICTCDYDFWKAGAGAAECAAHCLAEICRIGRGIILLHDSSENPRDRANNRTREVTELIVPELMARGFRFVALDEIPQVDSACRTRGLATLSRSDGRVLTFDAASGAGFRIPGLNDHDCWGLVPLADKTALLRAPNGCYLAAGPDLGRAPFAASTSLLHPGNLRVCPGRAGEAWLRTGDGRFRSGKLHLVPI